MVELPESAFLPVRPRCRRCNGAMNRTDMPRMRRRYLYHTGNPTMVEYERPVSKPDPKPRYCAGCKAKLRRSNEGNYCSPCKRKHGEIDTTALSDEHRVRAMRAKTNPSG